MSKITKASTTTSTKTVTTRKAPLTSKTTEAEFRTNLDKQPNGCELWAHGQFANGYGLSRWNGQQEYAHRVAYSIYHNEGRPLPDGLYVLHAVGCSSRLCCAKAHLRLGTAKENALDKMKSGTTTKGKKINYRRLTETQKKEIFALLDAGSTAYRVSKMTAVSQQAISYLKKNSNTSNLSVISKRANVANILEGLKEDLQDAIDRSVHALGKAA